jgi:hypothetical protein
MCYGGEMRRLLVAVLFVMPLSASSFGAQQTRPAPSALPRVVVHKDPNCGCCSLWIQHLERAGFAVTVSPDTDLPAVRKKNGVASSLQSCHTALVGGYVVEGHVPADDVKRLLRERPKVVGIAAPGMPIGSPGMEQGSTKQPYDVLAFDSTGRTTVFSKH